MDPSDTTPIGIMADSHGKNEILLDAIASLNALGARRLIHLGDVCDSLSPPLLITQSMDILFKYNVQCVRGNNESDILHDRRGAHADDAHRTMLSRLQELPYTIRLGSLWFTHSAPFDYPAATKRPLSEFLARLITDKDFSFSILFRGHSHRPSVMQISGQAAGKIPFQTGADIPLDRGKRYIITAGAVESASSVLFLPREYVVRFVTVRHHA